MSEGTQVKTRVRQLFVIRVKSTISFQLPIANNYGIKSVTVLLLGDDVFGLNQPLFIVLVVFWSHFDHSRKKLKFLLRKHFNNSLDIFKEKKKRCYVLHNLGQWSATNLH